MGKGADRNKLCLCGSGSKSKDCCAGAKPQSQALTFEFETPQTVASVSISADGAVELFAEDGKLLSTNAVARHGSYYDRTKGPKALSELVLDKNNVRLGTGYLEQLTRYRTVFALDTNTRKIDGSTVSMCCLTMCSLSPSDPQGYVFLVLPVAILEFHNCFAHQERFSWSIVQAMIVSAPGYNTEDRYALVSDSDLGNHSAYNQRSIPIFGDTYLAANIDLHYASADAGRDPLNLAIKECDKRAKQALLALCKAGIKRSDARSVIDGPCTRFRIHFFDLAEPLPESWLPLGLGIPLRGEN